MIRVLVEDTVDLKVKHMDNTFDVEDVKVYIFDDFVFRDMNPHNVKYSFEKMLKKKTDFAGVILEMMKVNDVCLFGEEDVWFRVKYHRDSAVFRFTRHSFDPPPPLNDAQRICFVSTSDLSCDMEAAILDLLEPVRFCQTRPNDCRKGNKRQPTSNHRSSTSMKVVITRIFAVTWKNKCCHFFVTIYLKLWCIFYPYQHVNMR